MNKIFSNLNNEQSGGPNPQQAKLVNLTPAGLGQQAKLVNLTPAGLGQYKLILDIIYVLNAIKK